MDYLCPFLGGPPYSELNYSSTLHKHFPYEAILVLSLLHHRLGHFLADQERRHRSIHFAQASGSMVQPVLAP